jgi:LPS export ABC transporter protein LptC
MLNVRNLFWALPLLVLFTFRLWQPAVARFLNPPGEQISAPEHVSEPDQNLAMTGVVFSQFSDGRPEWRIKAHKLQAEHGEADLTLEQVQATFFGKPGDNGESLPVTTLSCNTAQYESETKSLTLKDNVVIKTEDGREMRTAQLQYLEEARELRAASKVRILAENFQLQGLTMTYNIDRQYLLVSGQVVAEFN